MKLILTQDVKGLGKKDQVIEASDGYARNYLLPKKIAILADNENMNKLQGRKDSAEHKKKLEIENAKQTAEKLSKMTLKIKVKTGENGKLFGSITSKEISSELKEKHNIEVDKKKIILKDPIKEIGIFNVDIKLYEGITTKLRIEINS